MCVADSTLKHTTTTATNHQQHLSGICRSLVASALPNNGSAVVEGGGRASTKRTCRVFLGGVPWNLSCRCSAIIAVVAVCTA